MFKNIFKRKKDRKTKPTISSPQLVQDETITNDVPTVIEATIEPTPTSSSIGTQAEFSPIRAQPSLLSSSITPPHPVVRPIPSSPPIDDEDDPGYSTVQDAIKNTNNKPLHISDKRQPPKVLINPPSSIITQQRKDTNNNEEEEEESSSVVTVSDDEPKEHQQLIKEREERKEEREEREEREKREEEEREVAGHIYAKVKKRSPTTRKVQNKKEVSFEALNEEHNDNNSSESEIETIQRSTSLPSHRLPPAYPSRRTESVNFQSLNLSNLPVYSLNQTVPLASGDRAYLLTRRGPDGKEETFTATVITPTSSPSPQREISSSIPTLSPLPPHTSTPITRAHSLQQGVNIYPPNNQNFNIPPPIPNMVRKTKPISFPQKSTKVCQSTQTENDENCIQNNEILKESLAQMTAELSTYSLNETEADFSLNGVPMEQLIQEIPCRLQNALKTLNETLAAKESQLDSYQNEITKLKGECKELKKANQRLTKAFKEQEECSRQEKAHLEESLSNITTEKEKLLMDSLNLKDKFKQSKNRHRAKVKELTEELNRLSKERDSFRRDLLEVQNSHTHTQSLLERHSSRATVSTIPLDEHKKTLHEFESLLQDVVKTSKSNQKLNSLKKENLSLMTQLNNMEEKCAALRKEQRNYEERLFKLQNDLQQARSREYMIASELSQALRPDPTSRVPYHHRSEERLHTRKPSYRTILSNTYT